ncbi:hypothetical protein pipiens_011519 [Culex pipiens pipiens]|uniref:Uncharacterized protein n=1 Tax=Culex pipiens pipiens TaxID=38569 RepID=A0ABD1D7H2_CULPP
MTTGRFRGRDNQHVNSRYPRERRSRSNDRRGVYRRRSYTRSRSRSRSPRSRSRSASPRFSKRDIYRPVRRSKSRDSRRSRTSQPGTSQSGTSPGTGSSKPQSEQPFREQITAATAR